MLSDPATEKTPALSLHDALALGEIEAGLIAEKQAKAEMEEIHRLPVLLRLLSSSRPLSSVPSFPPTSDNAEEHGAQETSIDDLANTVVSRLEDVAATYSNAESIDVLTNYLAPSLCKKLSKLPPLKRKRSQIDIEWETSDLVVVGAMPRSGFKRRRVSETQSLRDQTDSADELNQGREDLSEAGVGMSSDEEQLPGNSSHDMSRRSSESYVRAGSEDSQEVMVSKTLSDLSALVVASLEPIRTETDADGGLRNGNLFLSVDDSALSEPGRNTMAMDGVSDVMMTGGDLGSTVASLMHYAPVLRHRHVANALCRAALPQAAILIKRIGANCPSAVPSLLRGSIDAYNTSGKSARYSNIKNVAKSAVKALAKLSDREKSRIRTTLQNDDIMFDVQLELAIAQDPLAACCLLVQHLSTENGKENENITDDQRNNSGAFESSREDYRTDNAKAHNDIALRSLLQDDRNLLSTTLKFIEAELSSEIESSKVLERLVRISLLLRSATWLCLVCDVEKTMQSQDHGVSPVLLVVQVLLRWIDKIKSSLSGEDCPNSDTGVEMALSLSLCASLVFFARLKPLHEDQQHTREICKEYVKACFTCHSINSKYDVFMAGFACPLKSDDSRSVLRLVVSFLRRSLCSSFPIHKPSDRFENYFSEACKWAKENVDLEIILGGNRLLDPGAMLDLMESFYVRKDVSIKEKVEESLTNLLHSGANNNALVLGHEKMPEFVVKAAAFLEKSNAINIPILSPLKLETLASRLDLHELDGKPSLESPEYCFLIQLLYWLAFMDKTKKVSLFAFDVRALPLKEVLSCSSHLSRESRSAKSLDSHLNRLFAKHCPEIPLQTRRWELVKQLTFDVKSRYSFIYEPNKVKKDLSRALKASLKDASPDQAGIEAERMFLLACRCLCDADLITISTSTLLSTPNSPTPYFTYSMICRDPLVLLKAPMRVWECRGLRRIALALLCNLLETNQAITKQTSPSESGADDLMVSRNLIFLRCVLVAVSKDEESDQNHSPYVCSMATNFMRMMVATNRGLVGMLIKQKPPLPECALDWFVEFVPESMDDSEALAGVLSERGSLTARLTGADAILRIAIAHGHRDEGATEPLVYAALYQLVSSFFLVLGPVGVPVNILLGDGSDEDVTQTSRRATFRILRSLVNVRGRLRTRLRNECGMALHKLAGLCKGENIVSGVAGTVVSRRKNLLREVFEAVSKAANAMGSCIDL